MNAPPICIKVKLSHCRNMPTKTFYRLLEETRRDCDRARNAMFRDWQRWREDNPNWSPGQRRDRAGNLKVSKDGKPVLENPCMSQDFERNVTHVGGHVSKSVAAKIISLCWKDVKTILTANVPYNHPNKATKFRWQAILNYELSAPCFRDGTIPLPVQDMVLGYENEFAGDNKSGHAPGKGIGLEVAAKSISSAVLRFPLLSNASGFKTKGPIVALNIGELKAGHRKWLRLVSQGKVRLSDSEISCRDGVWYANLMIQPPLPENGPDVERCAILTPLPPGSSRPFELRIPDIESGQFFTLRIGDGKAYASVYERHEWRQLGMRYRSRGLGGKGHGKGDFYRRIRPVSRQKANEQERFTKQLMADVLKYCLQNNCGSLLYREPTIPLRGVLWFASRGVPFDWSKFGNELEHKCMRARIVKSAGRKRAGDGWPRIGMEEHKTEYEQEWQREVK